MSKFTKELLIRIGMIVVLFLALSGLNSYLQVNSGNMEFWEAFFYPKYMGIRFGMAVVFSFIISLK